MRTDKIGQSTTEYVFLIVILAVALVAMRVYFVRAVQEKYRQGADVFGEGEQYATGVTGVTNLDGEGEDIVIPPEDRETCANIQARIDVLSDQINRDDYSYTDYSGRFHKVIGLRGLVVDYEATAVSLVAQARILQNKGMNEEAAPLLEAAASLRAQADATRDQIADKEAQISELRADNPDCF
ncbi:MAG: hypothetical protein FJZ15_06310 [Candidatus Omnitrophica bacterium]|nr:hypothetical protein [Candidatus Omnitrophota bacterium]